MSKTAEEFKNKVVNAPALSGEKEKQSFPALMMQSADQFKLALKGSGESADRFARICLTLVRRNKDLSRIAVQNPLSLIGACMDIAALGLDPSIPNETFIIPYKDEAKQQTGYKGLIKLARRGARASGSPLKNLKADIVYKNDTFKVKRGFEADLIHEEPPFGEERGEAIGFYALYETAEGGRGFITRSVDEIKKHQAKFCKSMKNPNSPFYNGGNFESYGLKTVLRLLISKEMDMSNKLASAIVSDIDDEEVENFSALKIEPREDDIDIGEENEEEKEAEVG